MDKKMKNLLQIVNCLPPNEYYQKVDDTIDQNKKKCIITANPEILMHAYENSQLNKLFWDENTEVIPDGIGVVFAIKHVLKKKNVCRNTGIELVKHLLEYSNEHNKSLFIYGSKEKVLNDFLSKCKLQYSKLRIVGSYNGYDYDKNLIKESVLKSNADIFLIALGTPKQELFIESFIEELTHGICVGVGGSLDVLSDNTARAPEFFIKHNLEWLYRITKEPKRIKRFINYNCRFLKDVII